MVAAANPRLWKQLCRAVDASQLVDDPRGERTILVEECELIGRRALLRRFPYAIHFVSESKTIVILAVFHSKPMSYAGAGDGEGLATFSVTRSIQSGGPRPTMMSTMSTL